MSCCWSVVFRCVALKTRIERLDESVAQDRQKRLEGADVLLAHAAAQFDLGGELVFTLVSQHAFAAANQGFPDRVEENNVLDFDVLLPVEYIDIEVEDKGFFRSI